MFNDPLSCAAINQPLSSEAGGGEEKVGGGEGEGGGRVMKTEAEIKERGKRFCQQQPSCPLHRI